jgi:hypothetical protein
MLPPGEWYILESGLKVIVGERGQGIRYVERLCARINAQAGQEEIL